jgi:hypothetical protein
MDWLQVLSLFLANAGLIVWFRSESRADNRQVLDLIVAIKDEMKDFHGRLERQDAEFKGRMEKQDAEFKAHIMYCHSEKEKESKVEKKKTKE